MLFAIFNLPFIIVKHNKVLSAIHWLNPMTDSVDNKSKPDRGLSRLARAASCITYPPELLPFPEDEAEVFVCSDHQSDGSCSNCVSILSPETKH
jgi:hypothetical protein